MTLRNSLYTNRVFFITYLAVLIPVGILQLIYSPEELMRWVNARNNAEADLFFANVTNLGDGTFMVIVAALLLIRSYRFALMGVVSFVVTGLLTIFLKQVVFPTALRPLKYFEHSAWQYHLIKGLDVHSYNSFPSGHSMTAFAVFTLLALLDDRKGRGWFLALLAVVAAYSRVYLFQHFVADVWVGSLLGVTVSVATVVLLSQLWAQNPKKWHNKGLMNNG
jgi:membrane-associated phospholipid phosphatase